MAVERSSNLSPLVVVTVTQLFAAAGPRLWNTLPEELTFTYAVFYHCFNEI